MYHTHRCSYLHLSKLINALELDTDLASLPSRNLAKNFQSVLVVYIFILSWTREGCIFQLFTPHAQRERGKVIDRGVHILYICLWSKKKFESYFRDRLTFSNVDSRTSRRIYRLALLLRAPETLSSLSKSRISIFNAHLTLLVRKMTSHNSIGKYRHLVN